MKTVFSEWNMRCPSCGGEDSISINAAVWLDLLPEGTTESMNSDHEWNNESPARCNDCDYSGTVLDFTVLEQSECRHCKSMAEGGLARCWHHESRGKES